MKAEVLGVAPGRIGDSPCYRVCSGRFAIDGLIEGCRREVPEAEVESPPAAELSRVAAVMAGMDPHIGGRLGRATVWPAYLINLARNTMRLANSTAQLDRQGIPFERIDAVDGRALPDAEIVRVYDSKENGRRARHPLIRSEIGCYLSHIAAWRRIAEGAAGGGFVFEDDFRAAEDLGEIMTLLSEDRRGWDMVKLFTLDPRPRCVARRALGSGHEIVVPFRVPSCTLGYGLTREAALRLVDRAVPFFRPVDEDHKFFWETGLQVALVLPAPLTVGDQRAVTGTIGTERRIVGRAKGVSRLVQAKRGLLYQIRYTVLLHCHRSGEGRR